MNLTEKSSYDELHAALQAAMDYSRYNANSQAVRRAYKLGKQKVWVRVNTPEKIPVLYLHRFFPKGIGTRTFLVVQGSEGDSYVSLEVNQHERNPHLTILRAHAINRYIERRQFQGSIEEATRTLINGLGVNDTERDSFGTTYYTYFDGGTFLCTFADNVFTFQTFIMNRQCGPEQRLRSLQSEKGVAEFRRELQDTIYEHF